MHGDDIGTRLSKLGDVSLRVLYHQMDIQGQFTKRRKVSVPEYETIEKEREKYIENPNFTPNFDIVDGWYKDHYQGKGLLVLKKVDSFYRSYERS